MVKNIIIGNLPTTKEGVLIEIKLSYVKPQKPSYVGERIRRGGYWCHVTPVEHKNYSEGYTIKTVAMFTGRQFFLEEARGGRYVKSQQVVQQSALEQCLQDKDSQLWFVINTVLEEEGLTLCE